MKKTGISKKNSNKAFTVYEILITLLIIGVIAVFIISPFMQKHQQQVNDIRNENIKYKLTQAVSMMRANGELEQFAKTDDFVDVLEKYLKINKRCDAQHIQECWTSEKVKTMDGEYMVSNAQTRGTLVKNDPYPNIPNVGLILADGAHIILTYDPAFSGVAMGDAVSDYMKGLSYVTDVNGSRGPNTEKIGNLEYDIRGFNGASFSKYCDGFYDGRNCKAAIFCDTYIEDETCKTSIEDCKGYIDQTTKKCIIDEEKLETCAYLDEKKECHLSSDDCTSQAGMYYNQENKSCNSCRGTVYGNGTKCCATNYIYNEVCYSNLADYCNIQGKDYYVDETCYETAKLACSGDNEYYNNGTCSTCNSSYEPNNEHTECLSKSRPIQIGPNLTVNKYDGSGKSGCDKTGGYWNGNKCYLYLDAANWYPINCYKDYNKYSDYCQGQGDSKYSPTDYWAGAHKACIDLGMILPSQNDLLAECNSGVKGATQANNTIISSTGDFWASTRDANFRGDGIYFDNCHITMGNRNRTNFQTLCVSR